MILIRSLAVLIAGLMPAAAAAQVAPVRPVALRSDAAWFERYQDGKVGPEQTESWSKTFKVGPSGSLDLQNLAGDVIVTGGPGDEIKVDAIKRVRTRDAAAGKQLLSSLTIEAAENGGRVEIRTIFPRGRDISAEVSYTVQVPITAAVSVHTVAGDIRVERVKGEVRLETVSGNIVGNGLAQVARLKSVSGDIDVSEAVVSEAITGGTVSGSLLLRRAKARSIDLQSVSGDLKLEDVACERAQVRTVSGDVGYDGPLVKGGRYEFISHSGDVRVGIAGTPGFELTANSFSGDVRSELPSLTISGGKDDDMPFKREIRTTVGDGSALLVVKTFSGDLVIGPAVGAKGKAKEKQKDKQ